MAKQWQLQDAKARFSQLVDQALSGEVQIVTRHGRPAVAVISIAEYERLQSYEGSAWDLLRTMPTMSEDKFPITRDRTPIVPTPLP